MRIVSMLGRRAGSRSPTREESDRVRHSSRGPLPGVLAFAVLALSGCSKSDSPGTAPEPTYPLTGQILLIGTQRDETGAPLGDLMLDDADGVRVYLAREGVVVDSSRSLDGAFTFQVPLGTYRAIARIGALSDSTEEIHVHDLPRTFSDAIQLAPAGLEPGPNPFSSILRIPFSVVATGPARLVVIGLDGSPIKTLMDASLITGLHEATWDGTNTLGQPAPPGPYWIVLAAGPTREEGLAVRTAVSLSGSVEITSRLADEVNGDLGSRTQVDASGLRIHLEGPGGVDSTVTHDGRFRFAVAGSGIYRVWTRLVHDGPTFERTVTLATRDTTLEPLAIGRVGQLDDYPNPFAHPHGVGFEFNQDQAHPVEFEVWSLTGTRVWWQAYEGLAGLNHNHWNGVDMGQQPVANGSYVMVVRAGGTVRHNVVFKEEAVSRPFLTRRRR